MKINDMNSEKLYQVLTVSDLKKIAQSAGLHLTPDLEVLKPLLLEKQHILDIGCGYGRALPWLLQHTKAHITAIEKAPNLFRSALSLQDSRLELINGDFLHINIPKSFDCALSLWTGIADFSSVEIKQFAKKITTMLTQDGILCIDYIEAMPKNALRSDQHEDMLHVTGLGKAEGYVYRPPFDKLRNLLESEGLQYKETLHYNAGGSDKVIYIFCI
ncbi:class I SAM-dependent methyltransferase [Facilibium subflavum]|uniref:class I SAM-dependent methyltransferase n=1 Tax=Facilibium subflavum TaxID=2219058 RepID=UPI000E65B1E4|nr:class I SAM-dependent methyltransferase [Facilibium subflavum]